jgi:uncharacterized glyoxalase superfamily protein PhnB
MLANRSMPPCTVIPVLSYEDVAEAAGWLCETFGFTERWRAGNHRLQLAVGDGAVIVTERRVDRPVDSPPSDHRPRQSHGCHSVMVRIEDVDSHYDRARQRGAQILQPPTDYPYGERQYTAEDPGGHRWSFSQSISDVVPEEWGGTSAETSRQAD